MLLDTYNFKLLDPMLEYMHIYLWDIVNIIILQLFYVNMYSDTLMPQSSEQYGQLFYV